MRSVICHYHIFKNSGTSFDALLKKNFGEEGILCFDGPFPFFSINQDELLKVIRRHPTAIAFSSHQIALPVPVSLNVKILSAVFVRHPLLRIRSVYRFKRRADDGTEMSTRAATMSFDEWCRFYLGDARGIGNVSNVQTRLLGAIHGAPALSFREPEAIRYDLDQALRNLRTVELLGRTECFDQDVQRFKNILAKEGIQLEHTEIEPQNVSSTDLDKPVDERLARLEDELEASTFKQLTAANHQDFALCDAASKQIQQHC